jgi:hypothetical protein
MFLLAIGTLAVAAAFALWQTPATGTTLWTMRLAVGGLVVTTLLGSLLAEALAQGFVVPFLLLTDIHLAWGLGGWALTLLAAVSFHVVPMFQLTRAYPLWFTRAFGPLLLALLLAWTARLLIDDEVWSTCIALALPSAGSVYALLTLWLQHTRRRKTGDATLLYFRLAMLSLLAFAVSGVGALMLPDLASDPRAAVWLGALALVGVFVSAISGMMYKILPFINWLHLQRLGAPMSAVPNMKQMISAAAMMGQFRLHVAALALLLASVWQPALARPTGLVLAASFAWLGWNVLAAGRRYRVFRDQIRPALAVAEVPRSR